MIEVLIFSNLNFINYDPAVVLIDGSPSNTITRSAKYVAIIKSCSTTNAVFLVCKINLYLSIYL